MNDNINEILDLKHKLAENTLLIQLLKNKLDEYRKKYKLAYIVSNWGPVSIVLVFGVIGCIIGGLAGYCTLLASIFGSFLVFLPFSLLKSSMKGNIDYITHIINKKEKLNEYYLNELNSKNNSLINNQINVEEIVKRRIEDKFGMSYDEFDKLELSEQHRLIEKANGKKIVADYRPLIDGMPMDNNRIKTLDEVDKKINQITSEGPKRVLKKK